MQTALHVMLRPSAGLRINSSEASAFSSTYIKADPSAPPLDDILTTAPLPVFIQT
jgi:hypothetical protein